MINPAHAKALRGHKTDAKDCARLAELFECGLLRGSYIPPAELKEVRDLTRYNVKTVQARTSEIQRLGKALESAGIKLGCQQHNRGSLHGNDQGADRRGTTRRRAGGPGDFGPPFMARRCEQSITARDQSSAPAVCSSASRFSCSRVQTPALFRSRSRRQQVMPEPNPSS